GGVAPAAPRGTRRDFCASLPARLIAPEPSPCIANAKSARPSWRASVSRARQRARVARAAALTARGASGARCVGAPPPAGAAAGAGGRDPAAVAERADEPAALGVDRVALVRVR